MTLTAERRAELEERPLAEWLGLIRIACEREALARLAADFAQVAGKRSTTELRAVTQCFDPQWAILATEDRDRGRKAARVRVEPGKGTGKRRGRRR